MTRVVGSVAAASGIGSLLVLGAPLEAWLAVVAVTVLGAAVGGLRRSLFGEDPRITG